MRDRARFDPELLDDQEPFEIDDENRPHLAKHYPHTADDLAEAWADPDRLFLPATIDGPADWLLVARLPAGAVVEVPLAPPRTGGWRTCRPIGIYQAGDAATRCYYEREDH
jgi:hypothetical protein